MYSSSPNVNFRPIPNLLDHDPQEAATQPHMTLRHCMLRLTHADIKYNTRFKVPLNSSVSCKAEKLFKLIVDSIRASALLHAAM